MQNEQPLLVHLVEHVLPGVDGHIQESGSTQHDDELAERLFPETVGKGYR
jgi:hypothetical protein